MAVPVGHPLASTTTAQNPNVSPVRKSFREGRTSSRAARPGALQSGFAGPLAPAGDAGEGPPVSMRARTPGDVAADAAAGTAANLRSDASRFTSAMHLAALIVSSSRPGS